jgi:hypothetical protein
MGYDLEICEPGELTQAEGYFRANIWSMNRLREAMLETRMAFEDDFPTYPENGTDAQYEEWQSSHEPADVPGIPLHKFCSNDGWHVLPVECKAALLAWHTWSTVNREKVPSNLDDDESEYWTRWLGYLRLAIDHGGFKVY